MLKPRIYFRADGNSQIGLGHVIRSLALADMLKDNFDCRFAIRSPLPTLRDQILEVCDSIIEMDEEMDDSNEAQCFADNNLVGNEIVVLDGYHFRTVYQEIIRNTGCKLICIDDIHSYHFVADVVINHSGGLRTADYSKEAYTKVFHGLQYALLREPFRKAARNKQNTSGSRENIFICFGGSDPNNDTLAAIKRCELLGFYGKIFVVIGGGYEHHGVLNKVTSNSKLDITVLTNLSACDMVKYMQKCAFAITPPSSVSYEYLSVGGVLFLKVIADNQREMYEYFLKSGLAFSFDDILKINDVVRSRQINEKIFDGRQKERFLKIFNFN